MGDGTAWIKTLVFAVIVILLTSFPLWAGGWNNLLIGSRAAAMGGAFTAIAGDPSSVFFNPAGLAFHSYRFSVLAEGFYVRPSHEYIAPSGTTARSRRAGWLPQFFAASRLDGRLTLGFGIFLPYAAGGVDWKKDEMGFPLKSALAIYSFSPALACRLSEKAAIGLSLNVYQARLSLATDFDPFGLVDNQERGWAVSGSLGFLFLPTRNLSLGCSLRGPCRVKTAGKTSMRVLGLDFDIPSETSFRLPWDVEAGLSYRLGENLLIAGSLECAFWSTLDTLEKTFKDVPLVGDLPLPEPMNFRDILMGRIGMEWTLSPSLLVRAGLALDPAASPESTLNPGNIDVDKWTVSAGWGFVRGKMAIDFAVGYAFGASRENGPGPAASPAAGKYDLDVFFVGLGIRYSWER